MDAINPVTVCVFAGAGGSAALVRDAETIGCELAVQGCHVYYGGSSRGVMGGLARGFKTGKKVYGSSAVMTGVLPESIARLNHFDPELDLIVRPDMASRKKVFWDSCDAYLCLPGGFGTLDELGEILTEIKLGHVKKSPVVIYNAAGFYEPLKLLFANMSWHGMIDANRLGLAQFVNTPSEAVNAITSQLREGPVAEESKACLASSE